MVTLIAGRNVKLLYPTGRKEEARELPPRPAPALPRPPLPASHIPA